MQDIYWEMIPGITVKGRWEGRQARKEGHKGRVSEGTVYPCGHQEVRSWGV